MRVITTCEYLVAGERPQEHWNSFKFVRALKNEPFRGYARIPGHSGQLTIDNREIAFELAGRMLVNALEGEVEPKDRIVFVPVPGSSEDSPQAVETGRGMQLARAVEAAAGNSHWRSAARLYWDAPRASSHGAGGTRRPELLLPHLMCQPKSLLSVALGSVVLVDDVFSTGGHLQAAASRLRSTGYKVAEVALCVARTVWEQSDKGRVPGNAWGLFEFDIVDI